MNSRVGQAATMKAPGASAPSRARARSHGPAWLMASGGLVVALATGVGASALVRNGAPAAGAVGPEIDAPPLPAEEIVVGLAYDPGQTSGWHVHAINHIVKILSGELAVYDGACTARIYGPGETYTGGDKLHLVRNEGPVPVEMVVSVTESPIARYSVTHRDAPDGCPVS